MDDITRLVHDVKNLITAIDGRCQLVLRRLEDPYAIRNLEIVRTLVERAAVRLTEAVPDLTADVRGPLELRRGVSDELLARRVLQRSTFWNGASVA